MRRSARGRGVAAKLHRRRVVGLTAEGSLDVRKLRVLLVDQRAERSSEIVAGLEQAGCLVLAPSSPKLDLERAVAEAEPDLVIIDLDSPDRDTLEGMRRIGEERPRPIVLFVDRSDRESIHAAVRAGVAAYVVKGARAERVRPLIDVAIARFREHQALKNELRHARSSLEQRELVGDAKKILMRRRGLPEREAYALLRKMSMERHMKLAEVARWVIELEDLL